SNPTWMTCPLRSVGITPLPRYYETVRPCPADRYFRPRGASACAFSLRTASRFSSSVPEPGIESRHLCTGHHMASKQVSATLIPGVEVTLQFRCRLLIRFDAFSVVHLRSSLYSSHDVIYSRLLTMTFTTAAFDRSSSWLFEACSYKPASKVLPSSPAQHRAPPSAFLTQPLHGSGRAAFPHPALALGDDAHAESDAGGRHCELKSSRENRFVFAVFDVGTNTYVSNVLRPQNPLRRKRVRARTLEKRF